MPFFWDNNIIEVLERIRFNSIALNKKHTLQYLQFNQLSKWFDLPIIICSVFSASFQSLMQSFYVNFVYIYVLL